MNSLSRIAAICSRLAQFAVLVGIYTLGRTLLKYRSYLKTARKLHSVFPAVFSEVESGLRSFMGIFLQISRNDNRSTFYRQDLFKKMEEETGKKLMTIQWVSPVWIPSPILLTRDPVMCKHILKDRFDNWIKPPMMIENAGDLLGKSLININHGSTSPDHDSWSFQRKTASRIFTRNVFAGHAYQCLIKNCDKVIANIERSFDKQGNFGEIEMKKQIYSFTMDSIGEIGCGVELNTLNCEDVVPFAAAFDDMAYNLNLRLITPGWQYLGQLYAHERALKKDFRVLNELCYRIIDERENGKTLKNKGDILSLFMQSEKKIPRKLYRDIVLSFMFAGRDTTASALSFMFYLLGTHEEVQEKLYNEIEEVFRGLRESKEENSNRVTFDMLKKMPYLDAVVFESLRLFPPVDLDVKRAAAPDVLPNGVEVPEHTWIMFDIFAMNHDEDVYSNANRFQPERWLKKERPIQSFDQYTFPVFQGGPRICLGKDLAIYEAKVFIVEIIRKYKCMYVLPPECPSIEKLQEDVTAFDNDPVFKISVSTTFKSDLNIRMFRR